MGLLSGLLKLGGAVAAPFTGGASLALSGLGAIGDVAGKAAGGAAAGRQGDINNIMSQDALRTRQYEDAQNAQMQLADRDLARKGFTEQARGSRGKQALLASILGGGFQPTQVSVPGIKNAQISGGLGASLNNPGAQQAMQELLKQALAAQLGGDTFTGGEILKSPGVSQLPKAGLLEKILGGVGLGGSLLGGLSGLGGGKASVPSMPVLDGIYTSQLPGESIGGFVAPKAPPRILANDDDWSNR